jgi:hypothetical protein
LDAWTYKPTDRRLADIAIEIEGVRTKVKKRPTINLALKKSIFRTLKPKHWRKLGFHNFVSPTRIHKRSVQVVNFFHIETNPFIGVDLVAHFESNAT